MLDVIGAAINKHVEANGETGNDTRRFDELEEALFKGAGRNPRGGGTCGVGEIRSKVARTRERVL